MTSMHASQLSRPEEIIRMALKSILKNLPPKRHNFVLVESNCSHKCQNFFFSFLYGNLPKALQKVEFSNVFGISNFVDTIIDSWQWKSVFVTLFTFLYSNHSYCALYIVQ
ncbi:hypothetical protein CHS0354_021543 [Potamilus streckersoni]|uniref:Uncharacterized protein n=1 Tax=Potamilus streckersoni TaxID=2493646 RepID=A0AAE0VYD7_9BIVA|nr:hypothetical protein CHS0354_021543 [Potamilus streckersoni]